MRRIANVRNGSKADPVSWGSPPAVLAANRLGEVPEQSGRYASSDRIGPPLLVGLPRQKLRPALPQQLVRPCILDAHLDLGRDQRAERLREIKSDPEPHAGTVRTVMPSTSADADAD